MLTLYHAPRSRSSRFIWLIEELAAPYALKLVSIRRGDGSGALDPANPHPHGKVPVLVHDGAMIFESPAIALYLTDTFPKNRLGAAIGAAGRGAYLTWLAYYGDVLEPAFMSKFLNTPVPRGTAGWVPAEEAMEFVTKTLSGQPYLLGEAFSAADVLYGSTFALFRTSPLLPKSQVIEDYVARCTGRPAYARALAKDNG
ncbi:MAG TPA: glutathione S-transferase [Alphaproteobacteria bacterium]|nr:glutathione S-transferase [Alphaproteobacteria bacterium]